MFGTGYVGFMRVRIGPFRLHRLDLSNRSRIADGVKLAIEDQLVEKSPLLKYLAAAKASNAVSVCQLSYMPLLLRAALYRYF